MASALADKDLYALLGISAANPEELSESDIKKAYRKRALECHPDKRPGDKDAADEFHQLQQAYDVLLDPVARKAYDAVCRLRREHQQRLGQQDQKRARMVADLEERERSADKQRSQEEAAKQQLKRELERIRRQREEASREGKAAGRMAPGKGGTVPTGSGSMGGAGNQEADGGNEELCRTLKVSWKGDPAAVQQYTSVKLRGIFSAFGDVDDVVVKVPKSKQEGQETQRSRAKGTALIVMASSEAANAACHSPCGDPLTPLQVTLAVPTGPPGRQGNNHHVGGAAQSQGIPLNGERPVHTQGGVDNGTEQRGAQGTKPAVLGSAYRDYESETLKKMMEAARKASEAKQKG